MLPRFVDRLVKTLRLARRASTDCHRFSRRRHVFRHSPNIGEDFIPSIIADDDAVPLCAAPPFLFARGDYCPADIS